MKQLPQDETSIMLKIKHFAKMGELFVIPEEAGKRIYEMLDKKKFSIAIENKICNIWRSSR